MQKSAPDLETKPPGEAPGRILGLSHLVVQVADLAVSRAFYQDRLGMTVIFDGSNDPVTPNVKGMLGTFLIELEQHPAERGHQRKPGSVAPTFTVDDIDALFARLADVRSADTSAPAEMMGARFFSIQDPDANAIELIAFPNGKPDLAAYVLGLLGRQ